MDRCSMHGGFRKHGLIQKRQQQQQRWQRMYKSAFSMQEAATAAAIPLAICQHAGTFPPLLLLQLRTVKMGKLLLLPLQIEAVADCGKDGKDEEEEED